MQELLFPDVPNGWSYLWQDNAVYVSKDGGPWVLFMYFPPTGSSDR